MVDQLDLGREVERREARRLGRMADQTALLARVQQTNRVRKLGIAHYVARAVVLASAVAGLAADSSLDLFGLPIGGRIGSLKGSLFLSRPGPLGGMTVGAPQIIALGGGEILRGLGVGAGLPELVGRLVAGPAGLRPHPLGGARRESDDGREQQDRAECARDMRVGHSLDIVK